MGMMNLANCLRTFALVGAVATCALAHTAVAQQHHTQNVVVVMMDGMRWEEIFTGADGELLKTLGPDSLGDAKERRDEAAKNYNAATAEERRSKLMPFLWSVIAKDGQIYGNRTLGSDSHVTNGLNFSYPGYAETLTGLADKRVNSNDNVPNPNATVFEWLNQKPAFHGRVAAFGAWQVFDGIFRKEQCGFTVNAGYTPLDEANPSAELVLLNKLRRETVHIWGDEPFDPVPYYTMIEYVKQHKPRVLFMGLGETDDWAHSRSYAEYLNAAHHDDEYLRQLWTMLQSMPEYKDKTTLIVLPDHGRGVGKQWSDHGEEIAPARETWMAFMGPDTKALGERGQGTVVTESQIAATIAALLGEDYHAATPMSGAPIAEVLGK